MTIIDSKRRIFAMYKQTCEFCKNFKTMKLLCFLAIFAVIMTAGCAPEVRTESVDLKAVNDAITQLADKYMHAWNAKDIDVLTELAADDGLFCGTDPSEVLVKKTLIDMWTAAFSDPIDYSYNIDTRKIKLADDGKSAIVIEQITVGDWSPIMQVRQTFQIIKTDNNWEIYFLDWGFIAKNEDVGKLNKALQG